MAFDLMTYDKHLLLIMLERYQVCQQFWDKWTWHAAGIRRCYFGMATLVSVVLLLKTSDSVLSSCCSCNLKCREGAYFFIMSFHLFAEGISLPIYFGHVWHTLKRNLQDLLAPAVEEVAAFQFSWCAFCYLWPASGIVPAKSTCTSSIDVYMFGLQTLCVCVGDLVFFLGKWWIAWELLVCSFSYQSVIEMGKQGYHL